MGYAIVTGKTLNSKVFTKILISLAFSPKLAFFGGFLLYKVIERLKISKIRGAMNREILESRFAVPDILALVLLSLAVGGNCIGTVMGVLGGSYSYGLLEILGTLGMVFGILTWSHKIIGTVIENITDLGPIRAFSANISSGIVILALSLLGIPVPITQTLISSVIGVGIAREDVRIVGVRELLSAWLITLPASFVLAGILSYVLV